MKERKGIRLILVLGLLAVAALTLVLSQARAQEDMDMDGDGYRDSEEPQGIQPECNPNWGSFALISGTPDAFAIMVEGAGSLFPPSGSWPGVYGDPAVPCGDGAVSPAWYCLMTKPHAESGLGFNVIQIIVPQEDTDPCPDRIMKCYASQGGQCVSFQRAGKIVEDTFNTVGLTLGWCPQGTFNDEGDCIVYTPRVRSEIIRVCGDRHPGVNCADTYGNVGEALELRYAMWVILHELGHKLTVATCYDETIGGNHHDNHGCVMDKAPYVDTQGKKKIFHIPGVYCGQCQQAVDLSVDDPVDVAACEVVEEEKAGGKKK